MKNIIFFFLLMVSLSSFGQQETISQKADSSVATATTESVPMADKFREDGKIYVVVAVVLLIFIGMLFYIFTLEKKISRIEKEINSKK